MIRLLGIVISIGLADSLNPTTIAPALYLASGPRPRERVVEFTFAVFGVYLLGGLIIAFGPGMLLISLIPHPHHRLAYVIELVAGVGLLVGSVLLWRHRARLGSRQLPTFDSHGRSSWVIGATITAIELPTAFPYFAAIAAVVGADVDAVRTILLLVVFNLCFIAPLLGILAVLTFAGNRSERLLTTGREFLERHWPTVLACVGVLAGVFVMLLGITGLTGSHHNGFGRLMHRLRHRLVHPLK